MVQTTNNIHSNTNSDILSIQVSLSGLSFCTTNTEQQITAIEEDTFGIQLNPQQVLDKIKYWFDTNALLKKDFKKVEVIHQNDLYTLVPKALFDSDNLKNYLQLNCKVLENDFIAYDELEQHEIVSVYIPFTNINNFFFEAFGSFTYKHSSSILVKSLLSKEKNSDQITVFVNMNKKTFDLIVINKGKLILTNTFNYQTKEDLIYYILFTTEQLELNPKDFELFFLGDIQKESEYFEMVSKYIQNVSFGNHGVQKKIIPSIDTIQSHQHFVLLSHF